MALIPGTRLGVYEITAQIGEGGMGQVYRATDTTLGRQVAIKILPDAFAADPERLARFEREAKTLASLNHPHIAAIYGFEKSVGTHALVMELVEGDNLSQRLAHGPMPFDEALPIARQIVEALDAAHEQGIIHRDLKPANVKVRSDGTVKVLDFGLAKAMEPAGALSASASRSPTITTPAMTQAGMILGTAAYMSPEQAKGRVVDKRSDVWAFGCVFFEMLTGRRAFGGEDVTDTIAAVVRAEPDWSALPSDVPAQIKLLLARCLAKDRTTRVSDIGVARFLLMETIPAQTCAAVTARQPWSRRRVIVGATIGLATAIVLLALTVWVSMNLMPEYVPQPVRFVVVPPRAQALSIQGTSHDVAITPDGTQIVYRSGAGTQSQLFVRALNELDVRPLIAMTEIREPFISPDGRWVGFFAGGELRKVAITGGAPITICSVGYAPRGASWGPDDTIVFATNRGEGSEGSGLQTALATGGEPKVLTTPDVSKGERAHLFPSVLPGGRAVLFTIVPSQGAEDVRNAQVAVLNLETGQHKTLVRSGSNAVYLDLPTSPGRAASTGSGYVVFAVAGTIRAVRFDLARLEVLGDPVPIVEQVMTAFVFANFALSRSGTLVYVGAGAGPTAQPQSLVWVNRQGREEPIRAPLRPYAVARLSPDGTRVALDVRDQTNDIWTWDLARQTLTPLSQDPGTDLSPLWTPNGRRILWTSTRGGGNLNLYWQAADGTGAPTRLTTNGGPQFPTSMSPDGTQVAIFGQASTNTLASVALDISVVTLEDSSTPVTKPLIQSSAAKSGAEISPDGRWIAYQSDESGQVQIYVRPFPRVESGRWQASPSGGTRPAWARNGRELFYLDENDLLTSVPVQTTATTFSAGTPTRILETRYHAGSTALGYDLRAYDVSPDGQRFLMIKDAAPTDQKSTADAGMVVVLNWLEELKAKVPTK